MRKTLLTGLVAIGAVLASQAGATGLATCKVGPESGWRSQADLTKMLSARGWQIRRIKVDGNCYEVYALDNAGKRVETYFHPETFDPVPNGAVAYDPRAR